MNLDSTAPRTKRFFNAQLRMDNATLRRDPLTKDEHDRLNLGMSKMQKPRDIAGNEILNITLH